MRIGLNLLYLLPGIVGGTETYAVGLINGLAKIDNQNEYFVFVNRESAEWPLPDKPNYFRVVCPVQGVNRFQRYLFEQLKLPLLARKYGLQLLHSLGYVAPVVLPCRSVVSILDIIYDYPGSYTRRLLLKLLVALSAFRANHILTISEHSKRQIVSRLHISPQKVSVAYLAPKYRNRGSDSNWPVLKERLNLDEEYILAFSSFSPSKNIPRLLEAYAIVKTKLPNNLKLVLVGHMPSTGVNIPNIVQNISLSDVVIFTGYLPDEEIVSVLQHATLFVFPSLYEGFGIPVLEAMAEGIPVACSDIASLPEVAGNAAYLFNPLIVEEISEALLKLITKADLRAQLIHRGYQNLTRFSWKTTAEMTRLVYESAF